MKYTNKIKKVDLALIFMLEEERDYFLTYNKQFILTEGEHDDYQEFIFFDKSGKLRKGVMASNGKSMGNTEACALFYKLSRYFKADLYINLGVSAGNNKEINIGDVILVTEKLTTFGEENATDAPWQQNNITGSFLEDANKAFLNAKKLFDDFKSQSQEKVAEFKERLNGKLPENYFKIFEKYDCSQIQKGGCVTVPEVIKGEYGKKDFPVMRKGNDIIDMEVYYLVLWHSLIKKLESNNSVKNSKILVFKSPSDYGDEYKKVLEECGSRDLAMGNLCWVVSNYCTKIHEFSRRTTEDIYTFFNTAIRDYSSDDYAKNCSGDFTDVVNSFEKLCEHFIDVNDPGFNKEACITSAYNVLSASCKKNILLSGRSGTAKSTFMSYLYYYVLREGYRAILIDFSKYSSKTTPSDMQMIYFLEKLLSCNSGLYIFLDGIDLKAPYYNDLFSLLEDNNNFENISYCIGNVIDNDDSISLVPKRLNGINIDFCGVNLYSNDFDSMLNSAEDYFKLLKCDFKSDIIKPFILNAGINNVDFRLLSMMSNNCQEINKRRSLYTFLNNYIIGKFNRRTLEKYRKSDFIFSTEKNNVVPVDLLRFNSNSYAVSLAVSQEIIELFENNVQERLEAFLQSKFVLSDDMNLLLKHLLKHKQSNVIENIVNVLLDSNCKKSICVETQLLYSVGNVIKSDNIQYLRFKKYLIEKSNNLEKTVLLDDTDYSKLIQYRTVCIILSKYFNVDEPLKKYIELLLKEDMVAQNNICFHFLYYSKAPFTFAHINKFDMNYLNPEMFRNTYYVLKYFLEQKSILNDILSNNPFVFMNIVTYLQLVQKILIDQKQFTYLNEEVKQTIEYLKEMIDGIIEHKCNRLPFINKISDLMIVILNKI